MHKALIANNKIDKVPTKSFVVCASDLTRVPAPCERATTVFRRHNYCLSLSLWAYILRRFLSIQLSLRAQRPGYHDRFMSPTQTASCLLKLRLKCGRTSAIHSLATRARHGTPRTRILVDWTLNCQATSVLVPFSSGQGLHVRPSCKKSTSTDLWIPKSPGLSHFPIPKTLPPTCLSGHAAGPAPPTSRFSSATEAPGARRSEARHSPDRPPRASGGTDRRMCQVGRAVC